MGAGTTALADWGGAGAAGLAWATGASAAEAPVAARAASASAGRAGAAGADVADGLGTDVGATVAAAGLAASAGFAASGGLAAVTGVAVTPAEVTELGVGLAVLHATRMTADTATADRNTRRLGNLVRIDALPRMLAPLTWRGMLACML